MFVDGKFHTNKGAKEIALFGAGSSEAVCARLRTELLHTWRDHMTPEFFRRCSDIAAAPNLLCSSRMK